MNTFIQFEKTRFYGCQHIQITGIQIRGQNVSIDAKIRITVKCLDMVIMDFKRKWRRSMLLMSRRKYTSRYLCVNNH